jgi:hypothetical protein
MQFLLSLIPSVVLFDLSVAINVSTSIRLKIVENSMICARIFVLLTNRPTVDIPVFTK